MCKVLGRLLWRPHPGLMPTVPTLPLSWAPWLRPLSWDFLPCGQCEWTCPIPLCTWLCRPPAVTAVPLATLGTLGQGEIPEGVRAGPVSATIILIPVILLPAMPAVGTANAVCTTAKVPAVPAAGLASMAVLCVQGAAGMSVWLGWVRTPQGGWVRSLSSVPSSSPGCSCDPQGTVPARCPSWAEACFCNQVSRLCSCHPHTLGQDCSHCAPLFWNLGGPRGCEPCKCHAQHTVQPACHPGSEAPLHIAVAASGCE